MSTSRVTVGWPALVAGGIALLAAGAGIAYVARRDELEEIHRGEITGRAPNLIVVFGALGERLLEDRRVRRHAHERVFPNAAREVAVAQHRAIDEIEPDGDAGVVECFEILRHVSP